jgi:hypothetical protein
MSTLLVFRQRSLPAQQRPEIVVCARLPESERYPHSQAPARQESGARAGKLGEHRAPARICQPHRHAEQLLAGRIGGQTGCYQQFLRARATSGGRINDRGWGGTVKGQGTLNSQAWRYQLSPRPSGV